MMTNRSFYFRSYAGGFTILEVMFGALILGMMAASCLMALRVVMSQVETVRNNTLASQVLQSEMENLRLMRWIDIRGFRDGEFTIGEDFKGTPADNFESRMYVRDIEPELRQVSLEVEWTGLNGATSVRRYSTYFARNGLSDYDYRAFR